MLTMDAGRTIRALASPLFATLIFSVLTACSESGADGEAVVDDDLYQVVADTYAYRGDSPYADALENCAKINSSSLSCTPQELPPLGMQSSSPGIDDIMQRVLVSHDWMGERFETILGILPADIRLLMRSTTAVIIDADIRPSFYWRGTGAIYIDPAYLWVSQEEKATVSYEPDYRTGFGSELQFAVYTQFMDDGESAYSWCSMGDDDCQRELSDIELPLARLLYHELAHANDYLPFDEIASLDPQVSLYDSLGYLEARRVNRLLHDSSPLLSATIKALAEVRYRGGDATEMQKAITPETVGSEFHNDGSLSFYSYVTRLEDVAMLFEAAMMKQHYGFDFLIGVTNVPEQEEPACDDYILGWGQRNRLATALVSPRAKLVAGAILPDVDWNTTFANLGDNSLLPVGAGWCSGVYGSARAAGDTRPTPESEPRHWHHGQRMDRQQLQ